jgi:predicted permease
MRTLWKAAAIDPGFQSGKVLVLSIMDFNSMSRRYDQAKAKEFYRQLVDRLDNLPGVRSATWAGDVPLALRRLIVRFYKSDQANIPEKDQIQIDCNVVGPRYFETLGIPLARGRDFTERDNEAAPAVAIINESMAQAYWPGEDPIGKKIRVYGRARELYEIVGVARSVRQRSLWGTQGPYLYLPLYQRYFPEVMLFVKVEGDPMAMLPSVRRQVEAMDPDLPVFDAGPLSSQIDKALSAQRMAAALLSASGALALLLAMSGVYGVMGYVQAQRTREFGIRIALGAPRRSILRIVLRNGAVILAIGLAVGLVTALALARMVTSFLYGVSPADLVTFAVVSIALAAAALFACYVPARKASRTDPLSALRQE